VENFGDEESDVDIYLSEVDSAENITPALTESMIATFLNLTKVG
jgi:hypothetical protein